MEMVMRWRMYPTPATRNAIPEPFRPTPLQYISPKYTLLIDFVNWPSIRDQLILQAGNYDLDQIIKDIVRNTVVEVPELSMALNVHDFFSTKIISQGLPWSNDENNSGATVRPGSDSDFYLYAKHAQNVLSAGTDILQQLSRMIQGFDRERVMSGADTTTLPTGSSTYIKPTMRTHELASKYGLDKLTSWKLSREFAATNPLFDCTSGKRL
jgi:hypothetical protein